MINPLKKPDTGPFTAPARHAQRNFHANARPRRSISPAQLSYTENLHAQAAGHCDHERGDRPLYHFYFIVYFSLVAKS